MLQIVVWDFSDVIMSSNAPAVGEGVTNWGCGMCSPLANLTAVEWRCSPSVLLPKPAVFSLLVGQDMSKSRQVWSGATCWLANMPGSPRVLWRLLGIPGVRPSCWRWLWAVRAVAFKRQEGRQSWVRAPSVITRPVSVGNYVTNFFFF